MDHPTTKIEAIRLGAKHYFTGKSCKHGHVALRRVDGHCIECSKERRRAWRGANLEKDRKRVRENARSYRATPEGLERTREASRKFGRKRWATNAEFRAQQAARAAVYQKLPEVKARVSEKQKERWATDAEYRAKATERTMAWYRNPERRKSVAAYTTRQRSRRARMMEFIRLLSDAEWADIVAVENKRRERRRAGEDVEVDHFVPIAHSGLHVPWNLEVISGSENRRKRDKVAFGCPRTRAILRKDIDFLKRAGPSDRLANRLVARKQTQLGERRA